jgi:hypothetical protein
MAVFILLRHPAKSMTGKADGSRPGATARTETSRTDGGLYMAQECDTTRGAASWAGAKTGMFA